MMINLVTDWVEILAVLTEKGEIPNQTELEIHRRAWELAQSEAQLAHMRALAAPPEPRRDPSVFQRAIEEAEALCTSEMTTIFPPDREYHPDEATLGAARRWNAASAIVEALTPLLEQAQIAEATSHDQ